MPTIAIIGLLAGIALVSTIGILSARAAARAAGTPRGRHRTLDSAAPSRPNVEPARDQENLGMKMAAEGDKRTQPSYSSAGK